MDQTYTDELYEILDEMNSRIEDMVSAYQDTRNMDLVIARIGEKSREFTNELQHDMEKLDLMESELR